MTTLWVSNGPKMGKKADKKLKKLLRGLHEIGDEVRKEKMKKNICTVREEEDETC